MLMNEMLNAAEQLNLLKLIYDNTWRAINQQAGARHSKPKHSVTRSASPSTSAAKHKVKHLKPAKPAIVPVQPLLKPQMQPQAVQTKPKPFNTPTSQPYSSHLLQPANRTSDSKQQNLLSSADPKLLGKVGIATRNTNAH